MIHIHNFNISARKNNIILRFIRYLHKQRGCLKNQKTLTAKSAKSLRKERKVFNLRYLFFATFAKSLCVFAVKSLLNNLLKLL